MRSESPPRWEYRTVEPPREPSRKEARDPESTLNELAADGWELDETIDYVGGGTKLFVFRRPADGTDSEAHDE